MTILAIESSCDDTSAAIIQDGHVLSNIIASQEEHRLYGGVVPELASRQHLIHIVSVVERSLEVAGVKMHSLSAIAVTKGPGLMGSLMVGVSYAKALAMSLNLPIIEVHHMHAHILSHFATDKKPDFPYLCLTVSGGHTQIVVVKSYYEFDILGSTIDDAAGEAFDKVGKMLGLPYPAGPIIDKKAKSGNAVFQFARPNMTGYNYSFSGFKTSVLYFLRDKMVENPLFIKENLDDLCASAQSTIVEILMKKLSKAIKDTGIQHVALAGGVAANSALQTALSTYGIKHNICTYIPELQYCTDNAAMIGIVAHFKYLDHKFSTLSATADPRMPF